MADWQILGITTIASDFQPIGNFVTSINFRISSTTYRTSDPRLRSFGFAKMIYLGSETNLETRWYKFYPSPTPVLLTIPNNPELINEGFVSRRLHVRQAPLRFGADGIPWDITVEHLTDI